MPTYQYADQAVKTILTAEPTTNKDGNVVKWDISMMYALNGYKSTYRTELLGQEFGEPKPPESFTKQELLGRMPTPQWDAVFDSQYESVMVQEPNKKHSNFDFNSLE